MAKKEGGIVEKGHVECMKLAISVLSEFEHPLLVGFVRSTGYVWIVQKKEVEHTLEMIGKLVSYDGHITGCIEKKGIKKLNGVKDKEVIMLWHPINEITVDDPPFGKIHFKSRPRITPVEAFTAEQLSPPAI